jgi:hypothetical protein
MYQIHLEPDDKCLYKKIYLPYIVGLNKIYTVEEIGIAKRKLPSFEREFNLQWTAGFAGTFDQQAIEDCVKLGEYVDYNMFYQDDDSIVMGCDWGFGGTSNTALTITRVKRPPDRHDFVAMQQYKPVIEVVLSEVYSKPDFNDILNRVLWLVDRYSLRWCFCDASDPEMIRALCAATKQRTDYFEELKEWEERNIDILDPNYYGCFSGKFYPVVFSKMQDGNQLHKTMLSHARRLINSRLVAIPKVWHKLINDLHTAVDYDDVLIKDQKNSFDALDSARICWYHYVFDDYSLIDYSEGGEIKPSSTTIMQPPAAEPAPMRDLNRYFDSP